MKKFLILATGLALLVGLSGCRSKEPPAPPVQTPEKAGTLRLEFSPVGGEPATQMQQLRTLKELLQTALADAGVDVAEVRLTLGSSPAATAQAVAEDGVDAAFLPWETLEEFGGGEVLMTEAWPAVSADGGIPADWNGQAVCRTGAWRAGQRALVTAGPSSYGRQLASRMQSGRELTWEELSRARWGLAGERSRAAADHFLEAGGGMLSALEQTMDCAGDEELLAALAGQQIDLAVLLADSRIDHAERWQRSVETGGFGREASIWEETTVVGVTEPIYGSTLTTGTESLWAAPPFSTALETAMETLAEQESLTALTGAARFARWKT